MATQVEVDWLSEFPAVKRVFLGGCHMGKRSKRQLAHCHWDGSGICFYEDSLWDDDYPSITFLHEYAHAQKRDGHTHAWRRRFAALLSEWGYGEVPASAIRAHTGGRDAVAELEEIKSSGKNPHSRPRQPRRFYAADANDAHIFATKRERDAYVKRANDAGYNVWETKAAHLGWWERENASEHERGCQCEPGESCGL